MKSQVPLLCLLAALALVATLGTGGSAPAVEVAAPERAGEWQGVPLYRTTLTSPRHRIDRIYRSMQGPLTQTGFRLNPEVRPELLWLVGYRATIVDAEGTQDLSQEFMCHSSVATSRSGYNAQLLPSQLGPKEGRLFTLAQGQTSVRFPPGHAIPFMSHHGLELQSQVLNHNLADADLEVRHRISIDFVRDRDLSEPPVPMTLTGASGLKSIEGEARHFGLSSEQADPEIYGLGCSIGTSAESGHEFDDGLGNRFTAHWVVAPGREVNHTRVTDQLALPYDTTIHYAAVHLHPYAVSLELRDLSTGKTVFRVDARSAEGERIALEEVGHVSSAEGLPLHADHEYELVSVYENPTDEDQDAMAGVYLYVRVRDVEVDAIRQRAARHAAPANAGE